ncbi:MAG: hypothetical protein PHU43_09825 [Candidatus Bipolaricaulis sp.]|nr:hypothetical protein [Candidatus Bipolaricaulis sp.]
MYLDPTRADDLEPVETDSGLAASISGGAPIALDRADERTPMRQAWTEDPGLGGEPTISLGVGRGAQPTPQVRGTDGAARTSEPFTDAAGRSAFLPYGGSYGCPELATTFDVETTGAGIRLRNRDPQRPSMNLDHFPTVRDFFRSRDPYPEVSRLQFLREGHSVRAFICRDRDRREDFRFVRLP